MTWIVDLLLFAFESMKNLLAPLTAGMTQPDGPSSARPGGQLRQRRSRDEQWIRLLIGPSRGPRPTTGRLERRTRLTRIHVGSPMRRKRSQQPHRRRAYRVTRTTIETRRPRTTTSPKSLSSQILARAGITTRAPRAFASRVACWARANLPADGEVSFEWVSARAPRVASNERRCCAPRRG